jgi:small conductance mechanosensitive channel
MVEITIINLAVVIASVLVTLVLMELLSKGIRNVAKRAGAKPTVLYAVSEVMRVIWLLLAATEIISYLGLTSVYTTLTISGIAGIAISLSLQTTLSNVISGIFLFYDRTIRLDDDVQFSGIRGRIVHIALRSTWIEAQDGSLVMVGNSNLAGGPLINFTAKQRLKHLTSAGEK